ncbi:MAG: hypothetical protein A2049_10380 [Elusimicrobia bacterium GWA2_62_23]|nr:MAG: hypothetical protein A2049_10380 [Elusimicrobia bacterium GWA2_62_23]
MGNKFIEKHRRKSILATLLFIFRGRTKFIAILLMVTILSVPFVISGEMLGRIIELRPVAAFLRSVGMASVVSSLNPKYSNDLLKAALDKATEDSANNSFWNKFLKNINATLPPAGSQSSIALIRGGGDIFGLPEVKDPKGGKTGPGDVKGVVNEEERARGETGDGVNLESLLAGGADGEGGLYGDVMGDNLADRFGGAGNAPYVGSSMMGGGPSVGGRANGMYNKVYTQSGAKVPMPGKPSKVNTKSKMGRVSGFTWKNVGYGKKNAKMDVKLGNQRPMFQLAQTFALTATAYKSKKSASEYQAAYTGATYDGNVVNQDVMETDAAGTEVPDTAMTGDLIDGAGGMQDAAKACSEAQGTHGAKMSEDGKMMDETIKNLGKPPKCCGNVGAWNAKIDKIISYCQDFNLNEAQLAAKCQNKSSPMNCSSYNSMKIKKCSKLKCFLTLILAVLMIIVGIMTGQFWLAAIGVGMLVATMFPGLMGSILGTLITLGMAVFFGPMSKLVMSVMETAGEILGGAMSGDKN